MAIIFKTRDDKKLKKALELIAVKAKNSAVLKVGFKEGSTEEDGTPTPLVAYLNEFGKTVQVKHPNGEVGGTYYQMPRPFFRRMIAAGKAAWPEYLGKLLKENDYDAVAALEQLGVKIDGELKLSITELESPPLAQSTIDKKHFPKPLINKGWMWKNVTHWVDDITEDKK